MMIASLGSIWKIGLLLNFQRSYASSSNDTLDTGVVGECPTGTFLDEDKQCIDFCTRVTCQINTRCFSELEGFRCDCDVNHDGERCQNEINHCADFPCSHGTCVFDGVGRCECELGYTGRSCDNVLKDCDQSPCRNNGTCNLEDNEQGFSCSCLPSYHGLICQDYLDVCAGYTCQNNGSCMIVDEQATCNCTDSFVGSRCENFLHPCYSSPCFHGGNCSESNGFFSCSCPPGYLGAMCEDDVNECASHSCLVNETCINTPGSFYCRSTHDPCVSNPCLNGGSCSKYDEGFRCSCTTSFRGTTCDIAGADKVTLVASSSHIMAGEEVTFVMQCSDIGESPSFFFDMGDQLYFYAPTSDLELTQAASETIFQKAGIVLTLQDPAARYLYFYKHIFNRPGDYGLSLRVYNNNSLSAKYYTPVNVIDNRNPCFPDVRIINGGQNISSGPQFQMNASFVMQSIVQVPGICSANFSYSWTFYSLSPEYPVASKKNVYNLSEGVITNRNYIIIPAGTFNTTGSYTNELKVTVIVPGLDMALINLDRGWFNITPTVPPQNSSVFGAAVPSVKIKYMIKADEHFSLEAVCQGCAITAMFFWEVKSDNISNKSIWKHGMSFPQSSTYLVVKPGFLVLNSTYTFFVTVTQPDNTTAQAEYSAIVNSPPTSGECVVSPGEGYDLETLYNVECSGFTDVDLPLTYRFYLFRECEKFQTEFGILLYYGIGSSMPPAYLRNGNTSCDHVVNLTVVVSDSYGAYTTRSYPIRVLPKQRTVAENVETIYEFLSDSGILNSTLKSGNSFGVTQLVSLISSLLNEYGEVDEDFEDTALNKAFREQARLKLLESLKDLPVPSLDALEQIVSAAQEVTALSSETGNEIIKVVAADILANVGQSLRILVETGNRGAAQIQRSTRLLMNGVSNIRAAISQSLDEGSAGDRANSLKCVDVVSNIMDAFAASQLLGEEKTEFFASGLTITVQLLDVTQIISSVNNGTSKDLLQLPKMDLNSSVIRVQTFTSSSNMYVWKESSAVVNSHIVQLILKDNNTGAPLKIDNLTTPVHITLPISEDDHTSNAESILWAFAAPASFYSDNNITIQKVEIPAEKTLMVTLGMYSTKVPLHVLIKESKKPALKEFGNLTSDCIISPFRSNNIHEFHFFYPAKKRTEGQTVYYIGIVAGDANSYVEAINSTKSTDTLASDEIVNSTFWLSTVSTACLYFHKESETWKSDGCEVSPLTTRTVLHCDCYHLTTFAGGIFVVPNMVDPIYDAKLFMAFFNNPLLVSTVVAIWFIYFLLLLYTCRLDRLEESKRGVHILPNHDPSDQYRYVVTILTGLRPGAGTTAKVGIVLKGQLGQSPPVILNELTKIPFFCQGGEDSFLIAVPYSLGQFLALSIWHNGEGKSPQWFVDEVMVRDVQTNQLFFFLPNRWLAVNKEDGLLSAEIPVAVSEDLTRIRHRFVSIFSRGLRDDHIWFSIFFRPERSTFTRSQRLTCILSLTLTTMLASLMFYGIPTDNPDDQKSFQGFSFSWSQVLVGFESGLVALPVNIVIVQLFVNASPRDLVQKMKPRSQKPTSQCSATVLKPAMLALRTLEEIEPTPPKRSEIEIVPDSALIKRVKRRFPFWTAYIAWVIAVLTAVVASYFVSLYGLKFGRTKSYEWMVSFFSSMFQSTLIIQPLKVVVISFCVAVIFHSPIEKDEEGKMTVLPLDSYSELIGKARASFYRPPSEEWLRTAKKLADLSRRMYNWFMFLGWFVSFSLSVFIFAFLLHPHRSLDIKNSLTALFVDARYYGDIALADVKNVDAMWTYFNTTFIQSFKPEEFFPESEFKLSEQERYFLADMANLALGPAQLRQVRIKRRNCLIDEQFSKQHLKCCSTYDWFLHETEQFSAGWKPRNISGPSTFYNKTKSSKRTKIAANTASHTRSRTVDLDDGPIPGNSIYDPWSYLTSSQLGMSLYSGELETYLGGGYVAILPHNNDADRILMELKDSGWIDDLTRAIFLQFNTYNPGTHLVNVALIIFEFHPSGLIIPSYNIHTINLFDILDHNAKLVASSGIIASILFLSIIFNTICQVIVLKKRFFQNTWNVYDFVLIILGLSTFILYFTSASQKTSSFNNLLKAHTNTFVSFYDAVAANAGFQICIAFLIFFCNIKLWKILQIHRDVNTFLYVLSGVRGPLFGLLVCFLVGALPLVLAGMTVFGSAIKAISTLTKAYTTLFQQMVGASVVTLTAYSQVHRIVGPIYFVCVVVIGMFIFTGGISAVVMTVYSQTLVVCKDEIEKNAELWEEIKRFFHVSIKTAVIDTSRMDVARRLQDYKSTIDKFMARPKNINPNDWADLISSVVIQQFLKTTAEELRKATVTEAKDEKFRRDYAANTDEWFEVDQLDQEQFSGAATHPVDVVKELHNDIQNFADLEFFQEEEIMDTMIHELDALRDVLHKTKRDLSNFF